MGNNVNDQVKKAFDTVRSGGVILYPTDTIWGLGCDATNRDAIEKLNSIKKRNSKSPMLSLVRDISMISNYIEEMPTNHPKIFAIFLFQTTIELVLEL